METHWTFNEVKVNSKLLINTKCEHQNLSENRKQNINLYAAYEIVQFSFMLHFGQQFVIQKQNIDLIYCYTSQTIKLFQISTSGKQKCLEPSVALDVYNEVNLHIQKTSNTKVTVVCL